MSDNIEMIKEVVISENLFENQEQNDKFAQLKHTEKLSYLRSLFGGGKKVIDTKYRTFYAFLAMFQNKGLYYEALSGLSVNDLQSYLKFNLRTSTKIFLLVQNKVKIYENLRSLKNYEKDKALQELAFMQLEFFPEFFVLIGDFENHAVRNQIENVNDWQEIVWIVRGYFEKDELFKLYESILKNLQKTTPLTYSMATCLPDPYFVPKMLDLAQYRINDIGRCVLKWYEVDEIGVVENGIQNYIKSYGQHSLDLNFKIYYQVSLQDEVMYLTWSRMRDVWKLDPNFPGVFIPPLRIFKFAKESIKLGPAFFEWILPIIVGTLFFIFSPMQSLGLFYQFVVSCFSGFLISSFTNTYVRTTYEKWKNYTWKQKLVAVSIIVVVAIILYRIYRYFVSLASDTQKSLNSVKDKEKINQYILQFPTFSEWSRTNKNSSYDDYLIKRREFVYDKMFLRDHLEFSQVHELHGDSQKEEVLSKNIGKLELEEESEDEDVKEQVETETEPLFSRKFYEKKNKKDVKRMSNSAFYKLAQAIESNIKWFNNTNKDKINFVPIEKPNWLYAMFAITSTIAAGYSFLDVFEESEQVKKVRDRIITILTDFKDKFMPNMCKNCGKPIVVNKLHNCSKSYNIYEKMFFGILGIIISVAIWYIAKSLYKKLTKDKNIDFTEKVQEYKEKTKEAISNAYNFLSEKSMEKYVQAKELLGNVFDHDLWFGHRVDLEEYMDQIDEFDVNTKRKLLSERFELHGKNRVTKKGGGKLYSSESRLRREANEISGEKEAQKNKNNNNNNNNNNNVNSGKPMKLSKYETPLYGTLKEISNATSLERLIYEIVESADVVDDWKKFISTGKNTNFHTLAEFKNDLPNDKRIAVESAWDSATHRDQFIDRFRKSTVNFKEFDDEARKEHVNAINGVILKKYGQKVKLSTGTDDPSSLKTFIAKPNQETVGSVFIDKPSFATSEAVTDYDKLVILTEKGPYMLHFQAGMSKQERVNAVKEVITKLSVMDSSEVAVQTFTKDGQFKHFLSVVKDSKKHGSNKEHYQFILNADANSILTDEQREELQRIPESQIPAWYREKILKQTPDDAYLTKINGNQINEKHLKIETFNHVIPVTVQHNPTFSISGQALMVPVSNEKKETLIALCTVAHILPESDKFVMTASFPINGERLMINLTPVAVRRYNNDYAIIYVSRKFNSVKSKGSIDTPRTIKFGSINSVAPMSVFVLVIRKVGNTFKQDIIPGVTRGSLNGKRAYITALTLTNGDSGAPVFNAITGEYLGAYAGIEGGIPYFNIATQPNTQDLMNPVHVTESLILKPEAMQDFHGRLIYSPLGVNKPEVEIPIDGYGFITSYDANMKNYSRQRLWREEEVDPILQEKIDHYFPEKIKSYHIPKVAIKKLKNLDKTIRAKSMNIHNKKYMDQAEQMFAKYLSSVFQETFQQRSFEDYEKFILSSNEFGNKSAGVFGQQFNCQTKKEVFKNPAAKNALKEIIEKMLNDPNYVYDSTQKARAKEEIRSIEKEDARAYYANDMPEHCYCWMLLGDMLDYFNKLPFYVKGSTLGASEWYGGFNAWCEFIKVFPKSIDDDLKNFDGNPYHEVLMRVCRNVFSRKFINATLTQLLKLIWIHTGWQKILSIDGYIYMVFAVIISGRLTTLFLNTLVNIFMHFYVICAYCDLYDVDDNYDDQHFNEHRSPFKWEEFYRFLITGDDSWFSTLLKRMDSEFRKKIMKEHLGMDIEAKSKAQDKFIDHIFCAKTPVEIVWREQIYYLFKVSRERLIYNLQIQKRDAEFSNVFLYFQKVVNCLPYFILYPKEFEKVIELLFDIKTYFYRLHGNTLVGALEYEQVVNTPIPDYEDCVLRYFPFQYGAVSESEVNAAFKDKKRSFDCVVFKNTDFFKQIQMESLANGVNKFFRYGNFGGAGYEGGSDKEHVQHDKQPQPIDKADTIFQKHDYDYEKGDEMKADEEAVNDLYKFRFNKDGFFQTLVAHGAGLILDVKRRLGIKLYADPVKQEKKAAKELTRLVFKDPDLLKQIKNTVSNSTEMPNNKNKKNSGKNILKKEKKIARKVRKQVKKIRRYRPRRRPVVGRRRVRFQKRRNNGNVLNRASVRKGTRFHFQGNGNGLVFKGEHTTGAVDLPTSMASGYIFKRIDLNSDAFGPYLTKVSDLFEVFKILKYTLRYNVSTPFTTAGDMFWCYVADPGLSADMPVEGQTAADLISRLASTLHTFVPFNRSFTIDLKPHQMKLNGMPAFRYVDNYSNDTVTNEGNLRWTSFGTIFLMVNSPVVPATGSSISGTFEFKYTVEVKKFLPQPTSMSWIMKYTAGSNLPLASNTPLFDGNDSYFYWNPGGEKPNIRTINSTVGNFQFPVQPIGTEYFISWWVKRSSGGTQSAQTLGIDTNGFTVQENTGASISNDYLGYAHIISKSENPDFLAFRPTITISTAIMAFTAEINVIMAPKITNVLVDSVNSVRDITKRLKVLETKEQQRINLKNLRTPQNKINTNNKPHHMGTNDTNLDYSGSEDDDFYTDDSMETDSTNSKKNFKFLSSWKCPIVQTVGDLDVDHFGLVGSYLHHMFLHSPELLPNRLLDMILTSKKEDYFDIYQSAIETMSNIEEVRSHLSTFLKQILLKN